MSHRTHNGHLADLHTEHPLAAYGTVCLFGLLLILALAGHHP